MMREPLPIDCIDAPDTTHYIPDIVPRHHAVVMRGLVSHLPVVAAELAGPGVIAHYLKAMDGFASSWRERVPSHVRGEPKG